MNITNKKELLDQYRFKNFNIGDYLIMLTHELDDGAILIKSIDNKAMDTATGEIYSLDPDQLFIKVDRQLVMLTPNQAESEEEKEVYGIDLYKRYM